MRIFLAIAIGLVLTACSIIERKIMDGKAMMSPLHRKLESLSNDSVIVVAHRGDSGVYPENTLPAFESALRVGAEMVELDFRQTADGELVCLHDHTLDRTTDADERSSRRDIQINGVEFAALDDVDAGTWKDARFAGTRVPTLEAALRCIQQGAVTMIEHKSGDASRLVELLRKLDLVDEVLVQSFDWAWLREMRELEPRLTLAALGGQKGKRELTPELLAEIAGIGAIMVHWNHRHLSADDVRTLDSSGYMSCVYTADDVADFERLVEAGVDAITTNQPARLLEYREQN